MRRVRGLPLRFRFPWRTRGEIRREVDEELRFHLDLRAEELERSGLSSQDAQSEALRQFGDFEATRKSLAKRGRWGEQQTRRQMMFEDLWRDTHYAWRSLTRSPGFAAIAVLVLALGIGVNSAMFSFINMFLVRQVMVEKPGELLGVYSQNIERPDSYSSFSYPEYLDIRDQNQVFTKLAAHTIAIVGVADGDVTRRSMAGIVSTNYFDTFGVPVGRGRGFEPAEERPGSNVPVAVLSHDYWVRRGQDPNILGSTLNISGVSVSVVGVAAEGFTGSTAIFSPDLWLPLGLYERVAGSPGGGTPTSLADRQNAALMLFGRRQASLSTSDVETGLTSLAARLEAAYPSAEDDRQTFVVAPLPRLGISSAPIRDNPLAAPAVLLTAMSSVVLFIACLNLANMFLARGASRRSEMAIRLSLGIGRARLLRQLLTESLLLALIGGAAGLVLAYWGSQWLMSSITALLPLGITLILDLRPDLWVILATAAVCVLASLFFGLGPAWKLTGGDLLTGLKENVSDRGLGGRERSFLAPRNLLIIGQVALSLVLLTAGGLFIRGALAAARTTPGFSLDSSLLVELDPSLVGYDEQRSREVYQQVTDRVRSLPAIKSAALSSIVPFGSVTLTRRVQIAGPEDPDAGVVSHNYIIGDDYFESLRLPLLQGRDFTEAEAAIDSGAAVAIIDEPLATQLFPDTDALGQLVQIASPTPGGEPVVMEVVGIVPGLRHQFWDQTPSPHLYIPFGQSYSTNMFVHVRVDPGMANQAALLETIHKEIRALDPTLPVLSLKTMLAHRDESLFLWLVRAGGKLFSILGVLALFLALVGVYGVKAFVMERRTREIGIRMALGATRDNVLWQMVREGSALTTIGLGVGLLLALGVGQLLSSLLYEVSATDPWVFLGSTVLLAGASTLAAYLPVRRATRVEPTVALRHD